MTGVEIVTIATQALFLCVAVYVAVNTYRRPTRSNIYILLFFSLLAFAVAYSFVQQVMQLAPGPIEIRVPQFVAITLPYLLLRLAREFSSVPWPIIQLSEIGLIGSYALIIYPGVDNLVVLFLLAAYFATVAVYAAARFYVSTEDANGITEKRLRSLSVASFLLGIALLGVTVTAVTGGVVETAVELVRQVILAASALMYLIGFAPPTFVRRSWQEPELRQFLYQTLSVPRWSSTEEALDHIQEATASTVGAPHAVIGLWNPENGKIDFRHNSFAPGETIGGRAFLEQRPILSLDTIADDPDNREIYERSQAFAVIAAPITTEDEQLGVIALYSPNAPVFAEDDVALLDLLADQIAVLLENRKHLQAQAELAAREESTRLKDEFLSVAAHDLKTPLTTVIGTGQYLERRLAKQRGDSTELHLIQRLNRESRRLQSLVQGLLDASRIERGQFVTNIETTELSRVIHDVIERSDIETTHVFDAHVSDKLIADVDPVRIQQVLENLLENARKYSDDGTRIRLDARVEGDEILISVSDEGIGISPEEHDKVFDRFYRSVNSENGVAPGIGLGLYICKEIIDQHGGRIWVDSTVGVGTTLHISLQPAGRVPRTNDTVNTCSRR